MIDITGLDKSLLWGLVLAGGDGKRLQDYVEELKGERLPKQFVNFVGQRSMLEHTFQRAERLIPSGQILTIVNKQHLAHLEVRRQLNSRPVETVIVQPMNKDTGPGILLPLMFLYKRSPKAIVVVFPSDHFILEEERFIRYVHRAALAVRHDPTRMVLLAVDAHEPETEYGYIMPTQDVRRLCHFGTKSVSAFIEKPGRDLALQLMTAGGLWNSMTMVFKLDTLLDLVRKVHPTIYLKFCRILEVIGTTGEQRSINDLYELLEPLNFSKAIMEKIAERYPQSVSVLPVSQVLWSDWGSQQRVLQVLRKLGERRSDEAQTD